MLQRNSTMKRSISKKQAFKLLVLLLLAAGSIITLRFLSLQEMRNSIESFGAAAPIAYIAAFALLPIFLFPVPPLALVSGILFGVIKGTLYTLAGASINATLMFFLSRFIARDTVERLIRTKVSENMQEKLLTDRQQSVTYIFFILRLVPLVSYNLINYAAGITKIRYGNYMLSTITGILPGTIVFLNMGDKLLNIRSMEFVISVVLLLALTVISIVGLKWYLKKTEKAW